MIAHAAATTCETATSWPEAMVFMVAIIAFAWVL